MGVTGLGAILIGVLVVASFRYGKRGIAAAVALGMPFYDSAAVTVSGIGVSAYYVGITLLILVALLDSRLDTVHTARSIRPGLLATLWYVTVVVTLLGPVLLAGVGVYSSDIGLDQQVGRETPLTYTLSNVAQVGYLTLNLIFVAAFRRRLGIGLWFIWVAVGAGVLVASTNVATDLIGVPWPHDFFDTSPNNAFAYTIETARMRAQFSEPSHLGLFAATALGLFGSATLMGSVRGWRRAGCAAMSLVSLLLVAQSASGTALAGLGVAFVPLFVLSASRLLSRGLEVPPAFVLLGITALGVLAIFVPPVWRFVSQVIDERRGGGRSLETRTSVDGYAWGLVEKSWGLGVGLGSNRTSSMVFLLLSSIGIIGTVLFVAILLRSIGRAFEAKASSPVAVALIIAAAASAVSDPNFASPLLWSLLAVCHAQPKPPACNEKRSVLTGLGAPAES